MKMCFLNQSDDENYHLIRGKPSSVVADIDKADLPDYNNTSSIFYRIPPKCQSHCKEDWSDVLWLFTEKVQAVRVMNQKQDRFWSVWFIVILKKKQKSFQSTTEHVWLKVFDVTGKRN